MENDNRDLLIEINERLKKIEKWEAEERKRRYIRIGVISLIVIVLAAIIVPKAISAKRAYNEAVSKINEVTEVFDNFSVNDINDLKEKINSIDFNEIKNIKQKLDLIDIDAIQKTFDKLDKMDFNALEKMIDEVQKIDFDALNKITDRLEMVENGFGTILGKN